MGFHGFAMLEVALAHLCMSDDGLRMMAYGDHDWPHRTP